MNRSLAALALIAIGSSAPVLAEVGVSVTLGEPEFHGRIELDEGYYRPRVVYDRPVVLDRRFRNMAPIYVRAPRDQYRDWRRHCAKYEACERPVYFVRDEWYTQIYAPRYRQLHARNFEGRRYPDDEGKRDKR
jgi:hypothetical protein